MILEKIRQSDWWIKASNYKDRHYDETSGVMLSDHLDSVLNSIDKIFDKKENLFNCQLLLLLDVFSINREMVKRDLQIVALLHDIGKPEDDKSVKVEHPLKKEMVSKRHPVVGVQAAMNILSSDDSLNEADKNKVYTLIDEHDTPYGLYRQFEKTAVVPEFKSWKKLNNKIDDRDGVGLLYLLIFKLADIDGHESVDDVIWFFKVAKEKYFKQIGIELPIPSETDIR